MAQAPPFQWRQREGFLAAIRQNAQYDKNFDIAKGMLDPAGKKRYNTDGVHKKVTFLWRKRVFMEGKMIETLRKKTRTSYIIRAILTLVIAIGLLVWTKFTCCAS